MVATYCVECGTSLSEGSAFCSQCGSPSTPSPGKAPSPASATPAAQPVTPASAVPPLPSPPSPAYSYQPPATNGMATAGFVLALVSLFLGFLIIPVILAIVFSSVGISRARVFEEAGGHPIGRGLAVAGLTISLVIVFFWLLIVLVSV